MSDRAALIAAILEHPDEDTPRLAFADWLQEHAETLPANQREPIVARAEFIRAQIEAAKLPEGKRAKSAAGIRAAELERNAPVWANALGLSYRRAERGFLVDVEIVSPVFTEQVKWILSLEPVFFTLRLCGASFDTENKEATLAQVAALATNPHLRAVSAIETNAGAGGRLGAKRFIKFIKSPYLTNLKRIDLDVDLIGLAGVKALVASPAQIKLESLILGGSLQNPDEEETKATVDAVKLISRAPIFASLKELGLPFNGLGAKSIEALLASKTLPSTLSLDLTDNPYDRRQYSRALRERYGSVVGVNHPQ